MSTQNKVFGRQRFSLATAVGLRSHTVWPCPEVIKRFSCSTQLSMKFVQLKNLKLLTIANSFLLNIVEHEIFSANKYENVVGIFIFISRENFMFSWIEHEKKITTSEPGLIGPCTTISPSEPLRCVWAPSDICIHWRYKSPCASAQSDQNLHCPHEETLLPWLSKNVPIDDSDQTARLIWIFIFWRCVSGVCVGCGVGTHIAFSVDPIYTPTGLRPKKRNTRETELFPNYYAFLERLLCDLKLESNLFSCRRALVLKWMNYIIEYWFYKGSIMQCQPSKLFHIH